MKKNCFIIVLFLICSCTKEVKIYYPNGNIEMRYEVKDGIPNGRWLEYYEDGTLSWEGIVIGDKHIDSCSSYSPNGIIDRRGFYDKNGNAISYHYYDSLGNLIKITKPLPYNRGYSETYEDGKLAKWSDFVNREENGEKEKITNQEIFFDENGDTVFTKSRFIRFWTNRDTIELGDTIRIRMLLELGDGKIPGAYVRAEIGWRMIKENGELGAIDMYTFFESEKDFYGIAYAVIERKRGPWLLLGSMYQVRDSTIDARLLYFPSVKFYHEYYVK